MSNRNRTKYTILGMLTLGNLTGYEIVKMIQTSTNYFWSESEGQVYPALSKCVKDGFATCKEAKSQKVNRPKKIYSITNQGRKELAEWLKQEPQSSSVRNEFLLKLFFGTNIDTKENIKHILSRKKILEEEIENYQKIKAELVKDYKKSPHLKYWLMTLDYGLKTAKAELTWCKDSISMLRDK